MDEPAERRDRRQHRQSVHPASTPTVFCVPGANAAAYKQQLRDVQHDLVTRLRNLLFVNERALVTCEGAFSYPAWRHRPDRGRR